ncbi:MAG TPA: NADH-quinone oxidoreductase subunit J family protein [Candidatus Brocadiia bacterium]|nr:NADH-quinone oxidoreductase subunit J [Planctomycetota bacterium]MDO8092898.1 NADH-quinone oxidoreductase subunit J [Candidatus Brocadiales bacterium]
MSTTVLRMVMSESLIFYAIAIVAVGAGVLVVTLRNIVHAVMFLALFLLSIAGLYASLKLDFLVVVQVFIFVGAVVVLFLFIVMLTFKISDFSQAMSNRQRGLALGASSVMLFFLILALAKTNAFSNLHKQDAPSASGGFRELGTEILTTYVLPFELVSLVLLVALIGAIVIARKQ